MNVSSLAVSNGGQIISGDGIFGSHVLVTDPGSIWSNRASFSAASGFSDLTISNGAEVIDEEGFFAFGIGNNTIRVTAGGLWKNRRITWSGQNNSLLVIGGSVFATNLLLDSICGDNASVVQIDAGSAIVTNDTGDGVLEIRNGKFILSGGLLQVDKLVMTNGCGLFVRNGGTLIYGTALLDPNLDADGDGIPNGWEQAHGFDPLNAADANVDSDGDGMSNLQEFLAATDPTNSASAFRITSVVSTGDDILVNWMTGIGRTNALQSAAGDGGYYTNGFADIFTVTNAVGTTTNYLDIGAATNVPSRYYRIRLVP